MEQLDHTASQEGVTDNKWIQGAGEMAVLLRGFDWKDTAIGHPRQWSSSLLTMVNMLLQSPLPMALFWSSEPLVFYNDTFTSGPGQKDLPPLLTGESASELFSDNWPACSAQINKVMQSGQSSVLEGQTKQFFPDEPYRQTFRTFNFSPVFGENGQTTGVLIVCTDAAKSAVNKYQEAQNLQLFGSILEQAPDPIMIFKGEDLILELANEPLYRIWGVDESALGNPFLEILPEMKDQVFTGMLRDVLKNGKTIKEYEVPAEFARADGTREKGFFNLIFHPFREKEGIISGVLALAFDVTEQVLVRERMRKSEERFNALMNTTPDVVFRMNPDWSEINEMNGKGFVVSTDTPSGNYLKEYVPAIEHEIMQLDINEAIRKKSPLLLEHQIYKIDGTLGWAASRAIPIINEQGEITEWFGFATDITKRRQIEADLTIARDNIERSKRLYETIMDTTPDLIYVFDTECRVTYANKALLNMWGKTWEESIGQRLHGLGYEPWHVEMHEREIDQVLATRQQIRGTVTFPHATEGTRYYDYIFSPVIGESGEVEAVGGTTRDVTDFKKAEDALLRQKKLLDASVERFGLINRATQDAIWDWNLLTNDVIWNEAVGDMFGYAPEEVQGNADWWYSHIHPEDRTRVVNYIHEVIDSGITNWDSEYRFVCTDGSYKMVYDRGFVLHDAGGNAIRMLGSMQDITDRKRADAILTGQKRAFEQTVQNASLHTVLETIVLTAQEASRNELKASVLLMDKDAQCLRHGAAPGLPDRYNQMIDGTRIGKAVGSCGTAAYTGREVVVKDIATDPLWKNYKDLALEHGLRACWSTPIKSSNGEAIGTFAIYYHEVREPSEEDRQIIGILSQTARLVIEWCRHIAQREAAEHAMSESEERFRILAENLPQMIWMKDAQGTTIYESRQWVEYFGENLTDPWDTNCEPGDKAASEKAFALAMERACSFRSEVRLRNKAGEYRWHTSFAEPLVDAKGEVVKWVGALLDIHDQKTISEKLEKLVQDRTTELMRSNEDLQQFAHVASHDLKEPVRKITTFAKMLEDADGKHLSARGKISLEKVQHAAARMMNMVNGVLIYSQLAASEQSFETIEVKEVIESAAADLEVLIQQKSATITKGELPRIAGAPVLIHQLFYNLINNALKFSREGVPLHIKIEGTVLEDGMARIEVSDNGIGFEQEYAEKIFKTFSRLNSKDNYEGTGLGLALCRKIVTRHGGSIQAFGAPDSGATFVIFLPAATE